MNLPNLKKALAKNSSNSESSAASALGSAIGKDSESLGRDREIGLKGPRIKKTSFKEVKKDSRFQRGESEASPANGQSKKTQRKNDVPRVKDRAETFGEQFELLRKKEPSIRPLVRAVRRLADCINDGAPEASAKVIAEAKVATHRIFDVQAKVLVEVPDHKTRLAAVTLELAYVEGLPVKREIVLTGSFESGESVIERLKGSPEAMRVMLGIQKTGGVIDDDTTTGEAL
jgi:hypothetical protein